MKNRALLGLLAVVVILGAGLPLVPGDGAVRAQESEGASFTKLDILFVVDHSGSMYARSDPIGAPCVDEQGRIIFDDQGRPEICDPSHPKPMRQTAVQYLIDYLSIEPPGDPRVGVVYFGEKADVVVPLFEVTDEARREEVIQFLEDVPPIGSDYYEWTDTNAAFDTVLAEFEAQSSFEGRTPVVIFLSDGHPEIAAWRGEGCDAKDEYYARHEDLVSAFADRGVPFFTVLIALSNYVSDVDECLVQNETLKSYENIWRHIALQTDGEYHRVHEEFNADERRQELFYIYHAILARLLQRMPKDTTEIVTEEGQTTTKKVPVEGCEKAIIHVARTNPDIQVTLVSPEGDTYPPTVLRDEYAMYEVERPKEGDWTVRLEGGAGIVRIGPDCLPQGLVAELVEPSGEHPQCKPMVIAALLSNVAGEQTEDLLDPVADGWVDVQIRLPDGTTLNKSLNHVGNGRYEDLLEVPEQAGEYTLFLTAYDAGRERQAGFERGVSVIEHPYLGFPQPLQIRCDLKGNALYETRLMVGCQPTEDPMMIGATQVKGTFRDPAGSVVGETIMADDGQAGDAQGVDGIFTGLAQVPPGDYTLTVEMANSLRGAVDTISAPVQVPLCDIPCHCKPSLLGEDLGQIEAGQEALVSVGSLFDCQECAKEDPVSVALLDVPFQLNTDRITTPPGAANYDPGLGFPVPEGVEARDYQGRLQLNYVDGQSAELAFRLTVLPPPSDHPKVVDFRSDLGEVRAGKVGKIPLILNNEEIDELQSIDVELVGVPFQLSLSKIEAKPGEVAQDVPLSFTVPEDETPNVRREGSLRLTFPDGESRELDFVVLVLPPPTNPLLYVFAALGVILLLGAVIGVWRWQAGMGQLTGKIVYQSTPGNVGSMPDEELAGRKYSIVLDEFPEMAAASAGPSWDFDTVQDDFSADQLDLEEAPRGESQSLHTELAFTPRRGQTEALVQVIATNGQVLIKNIPIQAGDAPQRLRDGDTISVGGYTLRYESLEVHGGDDYGQDNAWVEDDGSFGYGDTQQDDYGGYGGYEDGGYGDDTAWDDDGGSGTDGYAY